MDTTAATFVRRLNNLWSATDFCTADLTHYAEHAMSQDVRRGVVTLGLVALVLLAGAAVLYQALGLGSGYVQTFSMLSLLALAVTLSTGSIRQTQPLYLLSIALLVVSGAAFVLLAHKTGTLSSPLMASVVLLFMIVPLVPWGLREALIVVSLIYLVFTLSTLSVAGRFDMHALWILQFMMLGSALATLTIVARSVGVRKHDIQTRYELEHAHQRMERLSYEDGLTGAWNRRYLDVQFKRLIRRYREQDRQTHFAVLDVDDFKGINDVHGHAVGDAVLKALVTAFKQRLGEDNFVFRVGGDEFALLFDGDDPRAFLDQAAAVMRHALQQHPVKTIPAVRMSIGVVEISAGSEIDLSKLYVDADKALYMAKSSKYENAEFVNQVHRPYTWSIRSSDADEH